jgi:hypothetical protein
MRGAPALAVFVSALASSVAAAATIDVAPSDSFAKIESAGPGDEVVIAPGTYRFRVYLTRTAPSDRPIVIRAQDPASPPVWDLGAGLVEDAPGSYTAGDRGRGCWQISGGTNIHISGLVITGCHNAGANSAGLRYYNGATGIILADVVFRDNDNGLTGGTQSSEITVLHCEFDRNGTLLASSSAPSHNLYIYGGVFTLRYCYAHDPIQGQNFHIRARQALLEYNWFSRAKSYQGDLMTDDDYDGASTLTQTMTLRGNVIVQGTTQSNTSQVIAVYNDAQAAGLTLAVSLLANTFVGPSGGRAALVHLANQDGTPMSARLDNNLIVGTTRATLVDSASAGQVAGSHNWLPTGADGAGLAASIVGSDPAFKNSAQSDFTLAPGSTAIGAAAPLSGAPDREYYRDETVTRMYRPRLSANDVGAFESTTSGAGIGPYGTPPPAGTGGASGGGTGGVAGAGSGGRAGLGGATIAGSGGAVGSGTGGVGGAPASGAGGCSCRFAASSQPSFAFLVVAAAIGLARRRRQRRPR